MAFNGTIFLFPTTMATDVADMNYTVVVLGGVLILSLIWYYFPVYGGVHWFNGPQSNLDSVGGYSSVSRRSDTSVDEKSDDEKKEGQSE